jgi:hypothetical protein
MQIFFVLRLKAMSARHLPGGVWDSSKDRIFRIKATPACAAARVAVCNATT